MNKKPRLITLATLGLLAAQMTPSHAAEPASTCKAAAPSQSDALMKQLNSVHQQMFKSMDCEGQNLALQLANQSCKGKNSCKGLNACKTEKNTCAGLGSCKGTSPGPFKDKNQAVDVAQKHMSQKRMNMMGQ